MIPHWKLIVTVPTDNLQLLNAQELRLAAGLEPDDTSHDEQLTLIGLQAAEALAGACGVAKAGYDASLAPLRGEAPRTLRAETLVQSWRVPYGYNSPVLWFTRWPALGVTSVTVDGTALTTDDWELDEIDASLTRISGNGTLNWSGRVVVEFEAGFENIPEGLKGYCSKLVGFYQGIAGADLAERSVEIPGVIKVERWVDTEKTDVLFPSDILGGLQRDGYARVMGW